VVDATGVGSGGRCAAGGRLGCELTAVVISGGSAGKGSVPKRDLMAEVLVLLEKGQLKIGKFGRRSAGQGVDGCAVVVNGAGRVRLGADGAGQHDDLAIALALACWRAKRRSSVERLHIDYPASDQMVTRSVTR